MEQQRFAMQLHGRLISFSDQDVASIRKLLSPGPLPLMPSPRVPATGRGASEQNLSKGGDTSSPTRSAASSRIARTAAVLVPL